MKKFSIAAYLLLFGLAAAPAWAQAKSTMDSARKFYAVNDFSEAQRCLESEVITNPKNAEAHYLLGNVFAKENRMEEAKRQYQWVVYLLPAGTIRGYSEQALKMIGASAGGAQTQNATVSRASNAPERMDGFDQKETNAVKKSATAVSRETEEKELTLNADRDQRISQIMKQADKATKELEEQMIDAIDANGRPTYFRNRVIYSPAEANAAVRQEYQRKIEAVKADAEKKASEIKTVYAQRATVLEQTAISADKSYLPQNQKAKVTVVPGASDMYTRNYQLTDDPSGNPVPIQAAPAKLLPGLSNPRTSANR